MQKELVDQLFANLVLSKHQIWVFFVLFYFSDQIKMMAFATSYRSLSSKCVHSISKRLLSSPSFPFSSLYRRTRTHSNLISPLAAVAFRSSPVRFTMNHPYNSPIGFGGDVGMSSDDSLKGGRGDQFTMDQSNNSQMKLSSGLMERYPKEMYNPGCDFEHWLVVMDTPGGPGATKEQIIDCYVQTLARVLGSEEEAKKKIYNVSCQGYYAFGCAIDEETCNKLEGLPGVLFTLPDSYIDVENKDYGAELYENGEIVERSPERQKRIQTLQWKGSQNGPKNNHRTIKQVKRSEHKEEA